MLGLGWERRAHVRWFEGGVRWFSSYQLQMSGFTPLRSVCVHQ